MSPGVGTAAEEAAKLLTAAEQWVRARAAAPLDDGHLATGAPECTSCPLCQGVRALRTVRPETVAHLLDAAGALAAALRAAVADGTREEPAHPDGHVQHIDLDG